MSKLMLENCHSSSYGIGLFVLKKLFHDWGDDTQAKKFIL